jgi:hypothetical protein
VRPFGEFDVLSRILDVRLVQRRIDGVGEDLVDAAPGHHVAAEKQREHVAGPRAFAPWRGGRLAERGRAPANPLASSMPVSKRKGNVDALRT